MPTEYNLSLDDLPETPEKPQVPEITDLFNFPVGFKFAFVGVGQAGGRITAAFRELGYGRVCAINTAVADLAELTGLPAHAKLDVGQQQGAGKDPATAARIFADKDEEIYDLFTRCWGNDVDYVFVCLSGAGGTGAGAYAKVVEVAKRYLAEKKRPVHVGCIMAIPKNSEGQRSAVNVLYSLRTLRKLELSPIIFIDNERFLQLYGHNTSVAKEKPASNTGTAKLLHTFNKLAGTVSEDTGGTTFDATDFSCILNSGVVAFAATTVRKWDSPADITTPIREQLRSNVLASVDLGTGTVAGLLYVLTGEAWEGDNAVKIGHLDAGTQMMHRILHQTEKVTVFPGVYPAQGGENSIKVLAMVGGLNLPTERITDLAVTAGESRDSIADFLGV